MPAWRARVRVVINRRTCLKSGQCTYLHPELFREDSDGFPVALVAELEDEQMEDAQDAADICPSQSITIEEGPEA
jgi:ferredoxin